MGNALLVIPLVDIKSYGTGLSFWSKQAFISQSEATLAYSDKVGCLGNKIVTNIVRK
jgi:hypothetical protein